MNDYYGPHGFHGIAMWLDRWSDDSRNAKRKAKLEAVIRRQRLESLFVTVEHVFAKTLVRKFALSEVERKAAADLREWSREFR